MEPTLVLSDSHGIYIPQMWCQGIDQAEADMLGIRLDDVKVCQAGPDQEWYWEAWSAILDSASIVSDGVRWHLHQDGDLWEVPEGYEWPECC